MRRRRLHSVSVTVRRRNEYSRWWPRVDKGDEFGMWAWAWVIVAWQFERTIRAADIADDAITAWTLKQE